MPLSKCSGPAREVKSGVLYMALKSGKPIIPSTNAVSRHLEFGKSWDRFHVPLPFSRIYIVHGPPIFVESEDDFERARCELKVSLDRITAEADRLASGGMGPILGPALPELPVAKSPS